MLFNSFEFIFAFLPITASVYYILKETSGQKISIAWLATASLFFYGWWNFSYLLLILISIGFNYLTGVFIGKLIKKNKKGPAKLITILGIGFNLLLLAYYKYAGFLIENINWLFGQSFSIHKIILPLAISFFTFQQITYLVDVYKKKAQDYDFITYCLFVTFFPQLIAGPIVHHHEMMPQFLQNNRPEKTTRLHENFSVGITLFVLGLSKKVLLADTISTFSTPVFEAAAAGTSPSFSGAWGAVIAYALQIYFDFSGYSDMAIGLARMFGIVLPMNFNSPYKASSIVEFWRRWHMTLSRFLWQYLYIPLGGNRKGVVRQCMNIMVTMLLGGLWHGAHWTFILWGVLHGLFIGLNHLWAKTLGNKMEIINRYAFLKNMGSTALTFFVVLISWVLFRAESLQASLLFYKSMFGWNGFVFDAISIRFVYQILLTVGMLLIAFALPNSQEWMKKFNPVLKAEDELVHIRKIESPTLINSWEPSVKTAFLLGILASLNFIFLFVESNSEFLYFQF